MAPPAPLRAVRPRRLLRLVAFAARERPRRQLGHPFVQSFEPGESWFWNYRTESYYDGPVLADPQHHPFEQPTPGPAGRVPTDWQRHLH